VIIFDTVDKGEKKISCHCDPVYMHLWPVLKQDVEVKNRLTPLLYSFWYLQNYYSCRGLFVT